METLAMEKIGELLVKRSSVMELMNYAHERALDGDIKEIRDFSPHTSLSKMVLEGREER